MNYKKIIVFCLLALISTAPLADTLIIDRIQQAKTFNTPSHGLTMNQVLEQFGEPQLKKKPIGNPPITEWKYGKFSVYFESKWVINSVVYKVNAEDKGPKYISQ